nr:MAG: deoxynucleoside kinase-like protein [Porcellio scaber clopovirus]
MSLSKKLLICFEGNIGSGKSSIISSFKRYPEICTYHESIDEWKNYYEDGLLEYVFGSPGKYGCCYYNGLYLCLFEDKISIMDCEYQVTNVRRKLIFMDGCGLTVKRVFIPFFLNKGYIDTNQNSLVLNIDAKINGDALLPDMVIYVKTNPEKAFERIQTRNREEEKNITIEDIKGLDAAYEKYIDDLQDAYHIPVFEIDGNKSLKSIQSDVIKLKPQMEELLLKKKIEKIEEGEKKSLVNEEGIILSEVIQNKAYVWNYMPFLKLIKACLLLFTNRNTDINFP